MRETSVAMLRAQKIIAISAEYFGVPESVFTSSLRGLTNQKVRAIVIYVTRNVTAASSTELGRAFRRDHTTIMVSLRQTAKRMEQDAWMRNAIEELSKRCEGL